MKLTIRNLIKIVAVSASFTGLLALSYNSSAKPRAPSVESTVSYYTQAQLSQSFEPCLDLFPNKDISFVKNFADSWKPTQLCSNHFAVLYSKLSKTPLVVVEKLNADLIRSAKGEERTDNFYPDPRLKREDSASLADFKGSNHDRGHNAPAGDAPDEMSMNQTFALSNMIPQDPTNNRKIWSKLEGDVRKFILRAKGNVFVYTGPLFRPAAGASPQTIGKGNVWVPTHIFKLVYDEASGRAWAYILTNTSDAVINRPMPYDQFVAQTGIKLLNPVLIKGSV